MNANELMQNDWVCLEDDNTPRQVDWIRSGEVGLFWNQTVTPPYLKPIPLTGEILEKNGFERMEGDRGFSEPYCVYVNDDFQYVIKVYSKDVMDRFSRFEIGEYDDNEYMSLLINYVHELQHALRLCGIEKEIIL